MKIFRLYLTAILLLISTDLLAVKEFQYKTGIQGDTFEHEIGYVMMEIEYNELGIMGTKQWYIYFEGPGGKAGPYIEGPFDDSRWDYDNYGALTVGLEPWPNN